MSELRVVDENVLARDVSFDEYMEKYAENFAEWIEGTVIKLSPVTLIHDMLSQFFILLLRTYLYTTKDGKLRAAPFVMRTKPGLPGREPDLHIVLMERLNIIRDTITEGPADIVIEIVSKGTRDKDLIEKFEEYQAAGVREYWIIDPTHRVADFYVLDETGIYKRAELHNGHFHSTVLLRFRLDTAILWQQDKLEDDEFIRATVAAMLKES